MTPRAAASEIAFLALIMQLILIVLGTIKYKSGSFKNSIHVSRWFKFFRIFLLLVGNFSICNEFGFFFLIIWQSHTPSFAGLLTIRVPSSMYKNRLKNDGKIFETNSQQEQHVNFFLWLKNDRNVVEVNYLLLHP